MTYLIEVQPAGRARFSFTTTLSGKQFRLTFRFSQYEKRWYIDLHDAAGALLAGSMKAIANQPLLRDRRSIEGFPAGDLILVDQRPIQDDPRFEDLGTTHQLTYQDDAA